MKKLTTIPALALLAVILSGCITSKAPDGTTTRQVDTAAVAQSVAIAIEILHDPAVSNAIYNATQPKK